MRKFIIWGVALAVPTCQEVRVVDDTTGRPVVNAVVDVYPSAGRMVAKSNRDGLASLHFPDSSEGPVTVRVCRWAYAPTAIRFSSSAQVPRPLLIRLRPDPSDTGETRVNRRCDAVRVITG